MKMELKHFNELSSMKRTLLLSFALMLCLVSYQKVSSTIVPAISSFLSTSWKWEKTEHNFGKVQQAKPAKITFKFTNTGDEPLVITAVNPSCGCTTPTYTKEPIMPGTEGSVTAEYNAANVGAFTKTISVTSNAPNAITLTITGEVVAPGN